MNLINLYLILKDVLLPNKSQPLSGTIIMALKLKKIASQKCTNT